MMKYKVEILRISPNIMDFFYRRFRHSTYIYTFIVSKNGDSPSNLPIPYKRGCLKCRFAFETASF